MCIHTSWKMEHKLVCNFCKQGTYIYVNIIYILIISILFLLKIMYIQLFES